MGFVPGVELARRFYAGAVAPRLTGIRHSAGLFGPGSEVLGFDTERSTDHDWGARVLLFVAPTDRSTCDSLLSTVPNTFNGYPAWVTVTDPVTWFEGWLGFDPRAGVRALDWLATPTQRLAEVTGGDVIHDGLDALVPARAALRWYPYPLWLYVLASQWARIGEEEAFVGRCAEVGDEAGAAVVTARLARDLMRLDLLQRKRYPPYSKWLGSAVGPGPLAEALAGAMHHTGAERERLLCRAYTLMGTAHNALGLTEPIDPTPRRYYDRPFQVLDAGRYARALSQRIDDPEVAALPPVGAIDQFADSTALLGQIAHCRAVTRAAFGR